MTKEDILEKFIIAGLVPSKYTIQTVLGFSAQTLVRRGFSMREIRVLYKQATTKNKVCPNCLVEFTNNINTYCSQSCAASVNNKKRKIRKDVFFLFLPNNNLSSCLSSATNFNP